MTYSILLLALAVLLQLVSGKDDPTSPPCTGHGCNHTNRNVGIGVGIGVSLMCIAFILVLTIVVGIVQCTKRRNDEHYTKLPS